MSALPDNWEEWPNVLQAELLAELKRQWFLDHPDLYVTDVLGESIYSKQVEILQSIATNRRTAVPSCFQSGKSWVAARSACWWLEAHAPGQAFVVSTAPTGSQVRAILWREVNRAHSRGRRGPEGDPEPWPTLIGRVNQTEWFIGNELVAYGRKPDEHNPDAFTGIHAPAVLVIIDEANGVPESLFLASEGLIANEDSRILAIGNPNSSDTYFQGVCKAGSSWHVITISAYDTPNFTGETMPDLVLRSLTSKLWVKEQIDRFGETHPYVIAKVFGQFPEDNSNAVIPQSFIRGRQAIRADGSTLGTNPDIPWLTDEEKLEMAPVTLGVDIGASEDGDPTVIYECRGGRPGRSWLVQSSEEEVVVGHVVQAIRETGAERVKVDAIGVGWYISSRLQALAAQVVHQAEVIPVNVALPGHEPDLFPNQRSETWWMLRELCLNKLIDLTDVGEDTVAELIVPEYKPDARGRTVVEPKKEIKKRLHRSTDRADALLLALYEPPQEEEGVVTWEPDYQISPF